VTTARATWAEPTGAPGTKWPGERGSHDAPRTGTRPGPRLSVVVVNWNGAEYLCDCLASVRADPTERELIVVDNGSSDASASLVAARFPEALWIPLGENFGFATAANHGLSRARGDLVLFLNPDARANEDALAASTRTLEERPDVGLVSVRVEDPAGNTVATVEPFFSLRALASGRAVERATAPPGPSPVDIDWCHGAFLLGRRSELAALGGFDESFFLYSEDMDLCFRVHESGRRVVYLPEVSIVHEGNRAGAVLFGERRAAAIFASELLFYARRHGSLATLLLRASAAAVFGARSLLHAFSGSPLALRYRALAGASLRGPGGATRAAQERRAQQARGAVGFPAASAAAPSSPPSAAVAPCDAVRSPAPHGGLTIGVLCRADEPALGRTLASLERASGALATSRGSDARFLVCVNGADAFAPGRAAAEARDFAAAAPAGRVEVLFESKADKARAWNLVRRSCATELIAFCDADVEVGESALLRLVEALERLPDAVLASARQVPIAVDQSVVARAAALRYRFDLGVVGGRLYVMRAAALERLPENLLFEDAWISATLGRQALLTVDHAEVRFRPPATVADLFRERLRTEAGKIQIRRAAIVARGERIARYPWRTMARGIRVAEWPLVGVNLGVRCVARLVAEVRSLCGRGVAWQPIASSKPGPDGTPGGR